MSSPRSRWELRGCRQAPGAAGSCREPPRRAARSRREPSGAARETWELSGAHPEAAGSCREPSGAAGSCRELSATRSRRERRQEPPGAVRSRLRHLELSGAARRAARSSQELTQKPPGAVERRQEPPGAAGSCREPGCWEPSETSQETSGAVRNQPRGYRERHCFTNPMLSLCYAMLCYVHRTEVGARTQALCGHPEPQIEGPK